MVFSDVTIESNQILAMQLAECLQNTQQWFAAETGHWMKPKAGKVQLLITANFEG